MFCLYFLSQGGYPMRKSCILFLALMLSLTLILPAFAADPVPVEKIVFDLTGDVAVAVG